MTELGDKDNGGEKNTETMVRIHRYIEAALTSRQTNYRQKGRRQRPLRMLVRKVESLIKRNQGERYRSTTAAAIGHDTPRVDHQEGSQVVDRQVRRT